MIATLGSVKGWRRWRIAWYYVSLPDDLAALPPPFVNGTSHIRARDGVEYQAPTRGRAFMIWPPQRLFICLLWLPVDGWEGPDGTKTTAVFDSSKEALG